MLTSELITRQTPPWRAQGYCAVSFYPLGIRPPFFSETLGPSTAPWLQSLVGRPLVVFFFLAFGAPGAGTSLHPQANPAEGPKAPGLIIMFNFFFNFIAALK